MRAAGSRVEIGVPVLVAALAAGAAASLGVADAVGPGDGADALAALTWIVGWVLLSWAVIIGGGHAVLLIRRSLTRRSVSLTQVVLAAVSLVIIAVVMAHHPLWGTGSAVGG